MGLLGEVQDWKTAMYRELVQTDGKNGTDGVRYIWLLAEQRTLSGEEYMVGSHDNHQRRRRTAAFLPLQ